MSFVVCVALAMVFAVLGARVERPTLTINPLGVTRRTARGLANRAIWRGRRDGGPAGPGATAVLAVARSTVASSPYVVAAGAAWVGAGVSEARDFVGQVALGITVAGVFAAMTVYWFLFFVRARQYLKRNTAAQL